MSSKEAQRIADSKGLDLVKISPTAVPPVCKIMDYNKFMYEKAKKEKEAKKNQKVTLLKEVQLSLNIEDHDLNTKMNHAKRFLGDGNKVKVALKLRDRNSDSFLWRSSQTECRNSASSKSPQNSKAER